MWIDIAAIVVAVAFWEAIEVGAAWAILWLSGRPQRRYRARTQSSLNPHRYHHHHRY